MSSGNKPLTEQCYPDQCHHMASLGHNELRVLNSYLHVDYRMLAQNLSLRWRHNGRDSVFNHQPHGCLLNRLFRRRSKKTSKLRITGLCAGNSPVVGEFPSQRASNAENVSIWWRHHGNLRVPELAMSCSDFAKWLGTSLVAPVMTARRSLPIYYRSSMRGPDTWSYTPTYNRVPS